MILRIFSYIYNPKNRKNLKTSRYEKLLSERDQEHRPDRRPRLRKNHPRRSNGLRGEGHRPQGRRRNEQYAVGQHRHRTRIQTLDLLHDPLHGVHGTQAQHHRLSGIGRLLRQPLLGLQGGRRGSNGLQRPERLGSRFGDSGALFARTVETAHRRHQPARRREGQLRGDGREHPRRIARETRHRAVPRQPGAGLQRLHRRADDETLPLQRRERHARGARYSGRGDGARHGAEPRIGGDGRRERRGAHGALFRKGDAHAGRHPFGTQNRSLAA